MKAGSHRSRPSRRAVAVVTLAVICALALWGCGDSSGPTPTGREQSRLTSGSTTQPLGAATDPQGADSEGAVLPGAPAKKATATGAGETSTGAATDGSGDGTARGSRASSPSQTARGYVVIKYWNDTVSNAPALEVAVGEASWKPKSRVPSEAGRLGPIPLGRIVDLLVYPDGRKGSRISVSIKVDPEMDSKDVDAIHVEVRDDKVRVLGNPLVKSEITAQRR